MLTSGGLVKQCCTKYSKLFVLGHESVLVFWLLFYIGPEPGRGPKPLGESVKRGWTPQSMSVPSYQGHLILR